MHRPRFLLGLTILLSFSSSVLSSNPDSELVQDSSGENEGSKSMSAQYRSYNDQRKDSRPSLPGVRVLRPVLMGSRIIWREVGVPRPFYREVTMSRPDLSAPANDKTSIGSGKPAATNKPPLALEGDSGSKIPEVSKQGETAGLPSPDFESDDNLETFEGEGDKAANDKNGENVPTGAQIPSGLKPNTRSPAPAPNRKVPSIPQVPQPQPIAPPPEELGNTHNKRISPDSNLFAGIVNNFAFKLMESLNLESNFVVSPLSIFVALAMCYLGSDGNTKAQLEQVLGMNENAVHEEHLHQGIKDLMALVVPQSSDYQLFVANGMFLGKNFTPDAPFMEGIQHFYSAEIKNLDFSDRQATLKTINDWVAKNTRNLIPNLINNPPPALTRLLLMNAVYFKGTWKMQFPLNLTYNGRFHAWGGKEQTVPTMLFQEEEFPFYRSDELRHSFIKLPYEGDQVSMVIALPYSVSEKPMPTTTDQQLCHVLDAMTSTELDVVAVPKFRLEHSRSLRRPLMGIGIRDLFDMGTVNLSRLRKSNDLYVSGILHKAVVEVNEEGTSAAASTAVRIIPLSLRNTPEFVASHPFAFYIVHEPSGLVLFHGKVFDFDGGNGAVPAPVAAAPAAAAPLGGRNDNMRVRPRPNTRGRGNADRSRVRLHGAVNYENSK